MTHKAAPQRKELAMSDTHAGEVAEIKKSKKKRTKPQNLKEGGCPMMKGEHHGKK